MIGTLASPKPFEHASFPINVLLILLVSLVTITRTRILTIVTTACRFLTFTTTASSSRPLDVILDHVRADLEALVTSPYDLMLWPYPLPKPIECFLVQYFHLVELMLRC